MTLVYRLVIAAAMVVSGGVHAYLYVHGYRHIPTIGTGFLVQAAVFCAVGALLAVGAPRWFGWASGVLSAGALAAFALSRTVGLFGFVGDGRRAGTVCSPQCGRRSGGRTGGGGVGGTRHAGVMVACVTSVTPVPPQ
ncbi:hypothetical protein NCCNTM_42550 [Mycolicibacterium sp. NCC-Tsukiji]|nr:MULTISPECIES: hypothetical protein [Mycolicibacterium]GCB00621.1 hypothetical protein NCCNTM_42550 [Mycolicibacterium sp. NCC-Tsukiji]